MVQGPSVGRFPPSFSRRCLAAAFLSLAAPGLSAAPGPAALVGMRGLRRLAAGALAWLSSSSSSSSSSEAAAALTSFFIASPLLVAHSSSPSHQSAFTTCAFNAPGGSPGGPQGGPHGGPLGAPLGGPSGGPPEGPPGAPLKHLKDSPASEELLQLVAVLRQQEKAGRRQRQQQQCAAAAAAAAAESEMENLDGLLPLFKPSGITSADVCRVVKHLIRSSCNSGAPGGPRGPPGPLGAPQKRVLNGGPPQQQRLRVGHGGTLDPAASGELLLLLLLR